MLQLCWTRGTEVNYQETFFEIVLCLNTGSTKLLDLLNSRCLKQHQLLSTFEPNLLLASWDCSSASHSTYVNKCVSAFAVRLYQRFLQLHKEVDFMTLTSTKYMEGFKIY